MFSVVFNVLWVSMFAGSIYAGVRGLIFYLGLKRYDLTSESWKGTGRIKDLEKLEQYTADEGIRRTARKAIVYLRACRMIMQLGFLALVLLIMLNAFLK